MLKNATRLIWRVNFVAVDATPNVLGANSGDCLTKQVAQRHQRETGRKTQATNPHRHSDAAFHANFLSLAEDKLNTRHERIPVGSKHAMLADAQGKINTGIFNCDSFSSDVCRIISMSEESGNS